MQNIELLKIELATIKARIEKVTPRDSYIDNLPFHLGMVGGSGKNVRRLNKRKEAYLDRTIKASRILTELYNKQNYIEAQIKKIEQEQRDIESGAAAAREERRKQKIQNLVIYWNGLKPGDELPIGNPNGNPVITKKNKKSVETGSGCIWKAVEIIGKDAAALL
jgi:type IV secretory pathway VirB4 component